MQARDFTGAVVILNEVTKNQPDNARGLVTPRNGPSLYGIPRPRLARLPQGNRVSRHRTGWPCTTQRAAYALNGDKDKAFEWLTKAQETGRVDMTKIEIDPTSRAFEKTPVSKNCSRSRQISATPSLRTPAFSMSGSARPRAAPSDGSLENIGDVDGDGVNDLTTSAPNLEMDGPKIGTHIRLLRSHRRAHLDSVGQTRNQLGLGIEAAGDTNADGIPDVIAGAPGAAETYVFFGKGMAACCSRSPPK